MATSTTALCLLGNLAVLLGLWADPLGAAWAHGVDPGGHGLHVHGSPEPGLVAHGIGSKAATDLKHHAALCCAPLLALQAGPANPVSASPQTPAASPAVQDAAGTAPAQIGATTADGLTREQMWSAPTAADWAKPCLVPFQRSWEDALALSRETGKAILICVNMDGEIASEHYAGVRYRQPEVAALYEPYVCVIASVYRHTPADYDAAGRRILCPRFGSVTCGEHIAIEPILYERFFDETRVAPRHIMVELDGSESYDVFYAFDTASVFQRIQRGISERVAEPKPAIRGDRSVLERIASPDNRDRSAVELAYLAADANGRRALLTAALEAQDAASADLLRLAIFGLDPELAQLSRQGLAQRNDETAVELIGEALGTPLAAGEQAALLAALDRLSERSDRARNLAAVQRGVQQRSGSLDSAAWQQRLAAASAPRTEAELAYSLSAPDNGTANGEQAAKRLIEKATAFYELALQPGTDSEYAQLMRADAERLLNAARAAGVENFQSLALEAALLLERGDEPKARAAAVRALTWAPAGANPDAAPAGEAQAATNTAETTPASNPLSDLSPADLAAPTTAVALDLFALARQSEIRRAQRERRDWPPTYLADINAAYEVLARHPAGQANQAARHYEFLWTLGAKGPAIAALERGLKRFPRSSELHQRWRAALLVQQGAEALEQRYQQLLKEQGNDPAVADFAGFAELLVAENHRQARRLDAALLAYSRGAEIYGQALAQLEVLARRDPSAEAGESSVTAAKTEPQTPASNPLPALGSAEQEQLRIQVVHFLAMAEAGIGRVHFELQQDAQAVEALLASFKRSPRSSNLPDGLNLTAVDTAKSLLARLTTNGQTELAQSLQAGLDDLAALDPSLLELPAYERGVAR